MFFVLYYKRNLKLFFRIDIMLYQHSWALCFHTISRFIFLKVSFAIGSPETRIFILEALARVNLSHWFNTSEEVVIPYPITTLLVSLYYNLTLSASGETSSSTITEGFSSIFTEH